MACEGMPRALDFHSPVAIRIRRPLPEGFAMRIALPPCLRYALVAAPLLLVFVGAAGAQPRFFPPIVVPIGIAPGTVALGDVDEDGHLDLVVASDLAAQVSIL